MDEHRREMTKGWTCKRTDLIACWFVEGIDHTWCFITPSSSINWLSKCSKILSSFDLNQFEDILTKQRIELILGNGREEAEMFLSQSTIDVLRHNQLRAWCYHHWLSSLGSQYFGRSPAPRESRCIGLSLSLVDWNTPFLWLWLVRLYPSKSIHWPCWWMNFECWWSFRMTKRWFRRWIKSRTKRKEEANLVSSIFVEVFFDVELRHSKTHVAIHIVATGHRTRWFCARTTKYSNKALSYRANGLREISSSIHHKSPDKIILQCSHRRSFENHWNIL